MKCCRGIAKWADAGKGQIYSEGSAMTARRSWQLTLNNDINSILPGRYDETFGSLCRTLSGFTAAGANRWQTISYVDLRYDSGAQ